MSEQPNIGELLRQRREELGLSIEQVSELTAHSLPLAEAQLREAGERFREFRRSQGLSQRQLAERAQMSPSTVSRIENGQWGRDWLHTLAIAMVLGVPIEIEIQPADDKAA